MVRQYQYQTSVEPLDQTQGYVDVTIEWFRPASQPTYRKGHHPSVYGRDRTTQPIHEDIQSSVSSFMDWYRPISLPQRLQATRCQQLYGFWEARPSYFIDGTDAVASSMTWYRSIVQPYRPKNLPRLFFSEYIEPLQPNIPVILRCKIYSSMQLNSKTEANLSYVSVQRSQPAS